MMLMVHTNASGWPLWLRRMVGGHWFRRTLQDQAVDLDPMRAPCALDKCGRPGFEHWRWCDEWRLSRREQSRLSLHRLRVTLVARWKR